MKKTKKPKSVVRVSLSLLSGKEKLHRREYYLALGKFINHFSDVESTLVLTLCEFARADKKTGKALFSGVRVEQASDFIRRLGAVKKIKESTFKELNENLLPQIKAIADLRNDVIHYGARLKNGRLMVDNQIGIGRTQVRRYAVSAKLMDEASSDLSRILLRLYMAANGDDPSRLSCPIHQQLFSPWQYKRRPARQKHRQSDRKPAGSSKAQAQPRQP